MVREAIHTVFLYHAIKAGLTMGIVNPGQLGVYDQLDPALREKVEDVVLNRRSGAGEDLVEFALSVKGVAKEQARDIAWRAWSVETAPRTCDAAGHYRIYRRGHRGNVAPRWPAPASRRWPSSKAR